MGGWQSCIWWKRSQEVPAEEINQDLHRNSVQGNFPAYRNESLTTCKYVWIVLQVTIVCVKLWDPLHPSSVLSLVRLEDTRPMGGAERCLQIQPRPSGGLSGLGTLWDILAQRILYLLSSLQLPILSERWRHKASTMGWVEWCLSSTSEGHLLNSYGCAYHQRENERSSGALPSHIFLSSSPFSPQPMCGGAYQGLHKNPDQCNFPTDIYKGIFDWKLRR